jgi:hypothetical protein
MTMVAAVVAFMSTWYGAGAADAQPGGVIRAGSDGVSDLGSWRVATDGTYAAALRALGDPSTVTTAGPGTCTDTWRGLGLRILFTTFGVSSECRDTFAQDGSIRGEPGRQRWRTALGLRIGDTVGKLDRLYPKAIKKRHARVIAYNLHPRIGTGRLDIITAKLSRNRVSTFKLWFGAAGD